MSDDVFEDEEGVRYRVTPKGHVAMFFMEQFNVDWELADILAQKIMDKIFLGGWIYAHETEVKLVEGLE